jgi:hypothetical protein
MMTADAFYFLLYFAVRVSATSSKSLKKNQKQVVLDKTPLSLSLPVPVPGLACA